MDLSELITQFGDKEFFKFPFVPIGQIGITGRKGKEIQKATVEIPKAIDWKDIAFAGERETGWICFVIGMRRTKFLEILKQEEEKEAAQK